MTWVGVAFLKVRKDGVKSPSVTWSAHRRRLKFSNRKQRKLSRAFDEIIGLANGNRLEFRDFGVFEPRSKAPQQARNPRTGKIPVPKKSPLFKAGRLMKSDCRWTKVMMW